MDWKLKDGARIGVVGGGPAGSFFSIFAFNIASTLGKDIKIAIFDRKLFTHTGPRGCNMCAGTIGENLVQRLEKIGLALSPEVIQHEIKGYAFHAKDYSTHLKKKETERIFTVFRGGGPYQINEIAQRENLSYDQYLLNFAISKGAEFYYERVEDIKLPQRSSDPVSILYNNGKDIYEADLVVGAFGVNTDLTRRLDFGYRPPATWHTCQGEIQLGRAYVKERFQDMIHLFPIESPKINYVAIIPKKDYITVSAIGRYVRIRDLKEVVHNSPIARFLPSGSVFSCHCHPEIPVTMAKRPYAPRLVIIGDASYSRYLKNGIESALQTAYIAAETAMQKGVSSEIFKKFYDRRCRKIFRIDNFWGKILFGIHHMFFTNDLFFKAYLENVASEPDREKESRPLLSDILWHMFTGDKPYSKIFLESLDPGVQRRFYSRILKNLVGRIRS